MAAISYFWTQGQSGDMHSVFGVGGNHRTSRPEISPVDEDRQESPVQKPDSNTPYLVSFLDAAFSRNKQEANFREPLGKGITDNYPAV